MRGRIIRVVAAASVLGAVFAGSASVSARHQPPVLVCHWTPAHGGSYVEMWVGNPAGHARHANNLIDPADGVCSGGGEDLD